MISKYITMALYARDSRLSDVLLSEPALIPVVQRMGVELGVGEAAIAEICIRHNIDCTLFLNILNTFSNKDYFPSEISSFTLGSTVEYLRNTSWYYKNVQLANIERHFGHLLHTCAPLGNLIVLFDFFAEIKRELESYCNYFEECLWKSVCDGKVPEEVEAKILMHEEITEKMADLMRLFVVSLKGECDANLCYAVISAISSLEYDLRQNHRILTRVLSPALK